MIAEYRPQTNTYYYYMSDQINSTRIITDGNGNVVYSALYGPYGDVQKVWTSTYDPKLKFSGKEREGYSELDYFGARYYDHNSYRFISVDPIINKGEALSNPQLWNLYAYCRNNPITFFDPDGRKIQIQDKGLRKELEKTLGIKLQFKNKENPNLVTGFDAYDKELKVMHSMFQEIIDHTKLIEVIDRTNTEILPSEVKLAIGGATFTPGIKWAEAEFHKKISYRYEYRTGFLGLITDLQFMPLGEKMLHEIIGHGYDWIKGNKITEKSAIKRVNKYYRAIKGLPKRRR